MEIVDRTDMASLVSPRGNAGFPIHRWFTYKHGFSKDLVIELVKILKIPKDSWVLDPFCGGGTTLLACNEIGVNSEGFDILPFAVSLTNVKVKKYEISKVEKRGEIIRKSLCDNKNTFLVSDRIQTDVSLVRKAFEPHVERELMLIRNEVRKIPEQDIKALFTVAFLSILESVSQTSKSGGFLRYVKRNVPIGLASQKFNEKISVMISDLIQESKRRRINVFSSARMGDARKLPTNRKFDAVITSPPYPNRHDYTRIYSLETILDSDMNNHDLKEMRYSTLRSHVEAKERFTSSGFKEPDKVSDLLSRMKMNGLNNDQVARMIEGYFEDMFLSLSEIQRCLNKGGKVALIISNVRYAGVNIPVDELIADIGLQVGLMPVSILTLRLRGNSSQQMRDYSRVPSRESVVLMMKK